MDLEKSEILLKLGKHICSIRKEKGMSQEALASKCELHRTYIGMVERGERNISLINIYKISKGLEVPIYELFRFWQWKQSSQSS